MTTFDLRPLFHSSIGFDRLVNLMESGAFQAQAKPSGYPPYNIVKLEEDTYEIVMAVAGFEKDQVSITLHENNLTIEAKNSAQEEAREYLHKGIAMRSFEKTFQLADHILVKNVILKNGLLTISLEREVPEERKPRIIPIHEEQDGSSLDKKPELSKDNR